jgi:Outer membrane protein beta-barrel domain
MKQLVILSVFTALAFSSKSQVYVQGGLNLANITRTNSGQTDKTNILPTFNAGFMGRFGLSKTFDLESGILFTGRGSKAETYFNGGNDYVKTKFNPLYLEVPLNLLFKIPVNNAGTGIFFNAGPYIAMGVAGKSKMDARLAGLNSSSSSNIKFSNDDPLTSEQDDAAYNKLKRFDYGLNFGAGVDFKKLLVKVNYGLGLAKINSTQSDNSVNDKNKYRTWSISLGIPLSHK